MEERLKDSFKYIAEGEWSIPTAVANLRRYADYLEELEQDGWEIVQPINKGTVVLERNRCEWGICFYAKRQSRTITRRTGLGLNGRQLAHVNMETMLKFPGRYKDLHIVRRIEGGEWEDE